VSGFARIPHTKLVNRWPASRIEELMPWAWGAAVKAERTQKAA
jgi:hypothetical protein